MSRIDTKNRKEFRVGDFFEAKRWKSIQLQKIKEWETPIIAAAWYNQGIAWFYDVQADYENKITVSCNWVWCWSTFYHDYPFTINWDAIVLLERIYISDYSKKYIVSILNKLLSNKYSYEEKCSADKAKEEYILLPVNENDNPDREYMENYMKNLEEKCKTKLQNLILAREGVVRLININLWKRFHLYDDWFFDIDSWTKLDKAKMKTDNPTVNFVGRANANNWVTTTINEIKNLQPYPAWYLTLSLWWEYLWSCFIQKKPFYTSQNVIVLKPKWNMPFYVKQFISAMVFREWRTFYKSFVDELNRHIKTDFSILLPVDSEWNPNREFMENYIKNLMEKNIEKLKCLN